MNQKNFYLSTVRCATLASSQAGRVKSKQTTGQMKGAEGGRNGGNYLNYLLCVQITEKKESSFRCIKILFRHLLALSSLSSSRSGRVVSVSFISLPIRSGPCNLENALCPNAKIKGRIEWNVTRLHEKDDLFGLVCLLESVLKMGEYGRESNMLVWVREGRFEKSS